MMHSFLTVTGAILVSGWAAWSQAAPPLSFEVASVKASAPCCAPGQWRDSKAGTDRIDFPFATLRYSIAFAYGVKEYQVSGPSWIGDQRFEILAKGPAGTTHDQLPQMLQTLLAQRFQLGIHKETREFSVYVLSVAKGGPRIQPLPADADRPEGAAFGLSNTPSGVGRIEAKNATMASLAGTLVRVMGSPVIDQTGLTGRYDMELEFSREDGRGMRLAQTADAAAPVAGDTGGSIFTSLQRYGLKLSAQKVPQDAIVVDRAEKVPTGN